MKKFITFVSDLMLKLAMLGIGVAIGYFIVLPLMKKFDILGLTQEVSLNIVSSEYLDNKFPNLGNINKAAMKFTVLVPLGNESYQSISSGHCFVHSNNSNFNSTFIGLPGHVLPDSNVFDYRYQVIDYQGRQTIFKIAAYIRSENQDAAVIKVDRIEGAFPLSPGLRTEDMILEDSAFVLSPFNSRSIETKTGRFLKHNILDMKNIFNEPGDSGSLVVGRLGVVGVVSGVSDDGKKMHFTPLEVFEKLYVRYILYEGGKK